MFLGVLTVMMATEEKWLLEQFGDEYKITARSIAAFHGFLALTFLWVFEWC